MTNLSLNSVIEGIADITLVYALLPNASISVLGVGWFLGIVFLFYMIFPFYCFLMRSKKNAWLTFVVCVFYNLSEQLYFLIVVMLWKGIRAIRTSCFVPCFFALVV